MSKAAKLIVLGLLSSVVLPSAVLATPPGCLITNPTLRHYLGGEKSSGTGRFWGISGAIEASTLDLCPGVLGVAPNATFVWVGLDNASASNLGWVQTGYVRRSDYLTTRVYTEAQDPSGSIGTSGHYYYSTLPSVPSGVNTHKVDLEWNGTNASSFWKYYLNGARILTLGYSLIPISPTKAQVTVEIVNPANQIPGTSSNHVSFGSLLSKSTVTGSYSVLSLNKKPTDSAISSHAQTDMTSPDSAWFVWDSRY